jgi:hypothetical protein
LGGGGGCGWGAETKHHTRSEAFSTCLVIKKFQVLNLRTVDAATTRLPKIGTKIQTKNHGPHSFSSQKL